MPQHRDNTKTFQSVHIAILTISDSRTLATDTSGARLEEMILEDGHKVLSRKVIPDDREEIIYELLRLLKNPDLDCIITNGGTGITGRDVTPEAFRHILDKEIEGFGEMFRMISYRKIGVSAMQSRALGGIAQGKFLFALPGSTSACEDGWVEILRYQLDSKTKPCNLIELMPRLKE